MDLRTTTKANRPRNSHRTVMCMCVSLAAMGIDKESSVKKLFRDSMDSESSGFGKWFLLLHISFSKGNFFVKKKNEGSSDAEIISYDNAAW